MNFKRLWLEWSVLIFQLITNRGKETKEPSESVCKQILNTPLLRLRNKTHWNQTLYPYQSRLSRMDWGVRLSRMDWGRENMESPLRLGLGAIYIAPLHGRSGLTTKVWVRSLDTILRRC